MPTWHQYTLALATQTNRAYLILIITLKQVLRSINIAYSKTQRTPLQRLHYQSVLFLVRDDLVTIYHEDCLVLRELWLQNDEDALFRLLDEFNRWQLTALVRGRGGTAYADLLRLLIVLYLYC